MGGFKSPNSDFYRVNFDTIILIQYTEQVESLMA